MSHTAVPVNFAPGINPEPDETKQNTLHIIDGNHVRFRRGGAEKFGGHRRRTYDRPIRGCIRSIMSFERDNKKWEMIATDLKLYAGLGSVLTNITPLKTSGTTLGTDPYYTGFDNAQTTPFGTTSGSNVVTFLTFMAPFLEIGDVVTISGVSGAVNGVPDTELNGTHTVINFSGGNPQFLVDTAATGSGFPTISAPDIKVKKIVFSHTGHGLADGDRVKVSGASGTVGGIPDTEVNKEHVIVVGDADFYSAPTSTAPSSYSTGGGAAVVVYKEIDAGECDAVVATGPGIGVPGFGLPGSIQTDSSLFVQPRIWWQDVFGDDWVGGPGDGGKCYKWPGDTATAPTIITNAPDADWGWVEDAKLVTLLGNRVKNSNVGDYTDWTPGVSSSAYEDDKEDATKLISRCAANGENLIFAEENKIFRMRWVGGAVKWEWKLVSDTIGLAGLNGAIAVGGLIYFNTKTIPYYYNGGVLEPIPNNTLRKYITENNNLVQRYKNFVWYNAKFDELWFHYCSAASLEPDRIAIFKRGEGHWTKREGIERSAADRGGQVTDYPTLAGTDGYIYQHELGYDNDTAAMNAWMQVSYAALANGKYLTDISGMEPDLLQTGGMTVELYGKDRMKDDGALLESFTLTEAGNLIECEHETRWRSWLYRSNVLAGYFRTGRMTEFVEQGPEF